MNKRLAGLVTTGALTLGALAGSVGSASATVARPDDLQWACGTEAIGCFQYAGPFANSSSCVNFVVGTLGGPPGWDCEYYNPVWFSPDGPGWYATSIYFPKYPDGR